jgi:hypothetical protein
MDKPRRIEMKVKEMIEQLRMLPPNADLDVCDVLFNGSKDIDGIWLVPDSDHSENDRVTITIRQ